MSKRNLEWEDYKEKITKKRTGKKKDKAGPSGLCGSITVQRLSANVEGKCQKYSRIGALTLVPLEEEVTLPNIKAACKSHFKTNLECDVLTGERGPSYTDASQIQNWKVIHIRFIEKSSEPIQRQSEPAKEKCRSMATENRPKIAKSSFAASVPLSKMLKLGKVIVPEVDIATLFLEEFSLTEMRWLEPFKTTFSLERKSFDSGGFRDAYLAKAISGIPKGKYVLKRYKEDKVAEIKELFGTTEAHTRKVIQMNALARNFAQNLNLERPVVEYGPTFKYSKVYYANFNGEYITVEEFIEGTFAKYINNNGEICGDVSSEISLKAEAFVHFTYVNSNQQLMVSDIQGVDYWLCDPEIASAKLIDENDSSIFFCCGNLSTTAIDTFFQAHSCNKFCGLLNLPPT
ncbi:PREDICTED: myosin heavy chain kinase B-like [Acropora digitifera]|uniref:myosin heavy chain kinase B-like n=1 Tax=Acropora digitifera TaxID=70779 RepID=UPI00077A0D57|nr:PREDICTED: myosin heavy chain kinase B-like [Acropora digitifera]